MHSHSKFERMQCRSALQPHSLRYSRYKTLINVMHNATLNNHSGGFACFSPITTILHLITKQFPTHSVVFRFDFLHCRQPVLSVLFFFISFIFLGKVPSPSCGAESKISCSSPPASHLCLDPDSNQYSCAGTLPVLT